jgi:hypothetical protein
LTLISKSLDSLGLIVEIIIIKEGMAILKGNCTYLYLPNNLATSGSNGNASWVADIRYIRCHTWSLTVVPKVKSLMDAFMIY